LRPEGFADGEADGQDDKAGKNEEFAFFSFKFCVFIADERKDGSRCDVKIVKYLQKIKFTVVGMSRFIDVIEPSRVHGDNCK
jgi:hypothetical protein